MNYASEVRNNLAKLPDRCFTALRANEVGKRIGIIKVGESGYYATDEPAWLADKDFDEVSKFVDKMNESTGVTKTVRSAMEHGSMFGWHIPAADPDAPINNVNA